MNLHFVAFLRLLLAGARGVLEEDLVVDEAVVHAARHAADDRARRAPF